MAKLKTSKQMERHLKGMANHYRVDVQLLLADHNTLTLEEIVKEIGANDRTIGVHVQKLTHAGLVDKRCRGRYVEHSLSPYGKTFVAFLTAFQRV